MSLKKELELKTDVESLSHEAILNIYYTNVLIKKAACDFFEEYGLTDVHFNVMNLLYFQSGELGGLSQVDISKMMLVNRANITTLIDRMEKTKLVERTPVPGDRRYNIIKLTPTGKKKFEEVEKKYVKEVENVMSVLSKNEKNTLISLLEKIREALRKR